MNWFVKIPKKQITGEYCGGIRRIDRGYSFILNEGTRYGAFTIFVSANQHVSMNMFGLPVSFPDELETQDKWFGVTYKEDKPAVVAACSEESRLFL